MRFVFLIAVSSLLLAGCTDADWSHALTRLGLNDEPSSAAPTAWLASREGTATRAPAATAAPVSQPRGTEDGFCENSAHQKANLSKFDAPTRERMYQAQLAQCLDIARSNQSWLNAGEVPLAPGYQR